MILILTQSGKNFLTFRYGQSVVPLKIFLNTEVGRKNSKLSDVDNFPPNLNIEWSIKKVLMEIYSNWDFMGTMCPLILDKIQADEWYFRDL